MKNLFFAFLFFLTIYNTNAQEIRLEKNQNADTVFKYSFGYNFSAFLGTYLDGEYGELYQTILIKRYYNKYNIRISAKHLTDQIRNNRNYFNIVNVTDTTILTRNTFFKKKQHQVNFGIERIIKTKLGSFFIGIDIYSMYSKFNKSYDYILYTNYAEMYPACDVPDFNIDSVLFYYNKTIDYLSPNIKKPYHNKTEMKVGFSTNIGCEWNLTKRFNLNVSFNPEFHTTFLIKQYFYDESGKYKEERIYKSEKVGYNIGWLNVYLSYKMF